MKLQSINIALDNWTLFLDRDGVINERPINAYVTKVDEFEWIDGVIQSISRLSDTFKTIVVVTNQQGLSKALMTADDLNKIHGKMLNEITNAGGRIDKVYFCGDPNNTGSLFRKPAIGMGLQAKKDFPNISFKKAIMVGDTATDMLFGKRLKMITVLIDESPALARNIPKLVNYRFPNLQSFADFICKNH